MLYVESRKIFEVESGKKFNSLPSVKKHSANHNLCQVPKIIHSAKKSLPSVKKYTQQTFIFAECQKYYTRQRTVCRVYLFCRVFFV